jgi:hypothetical protein
MPVANVLTLLTALQPGSYPIGASPGVDPAKLLDVLNALCALLGLPPVVLPPESVGYLYGAAPIPFGKILQIVMLIIATMSKPGGPTPADIQAMIMQIMTIILGQGRGLRVIEATPMQS